MYLFAYGTILKRFLQSVFSENKAWNLSIIQTVGSVYFTTLTLLTDILYLIYTNNTDQIQRKSEVRAFFINWHWWEVSKITGVGWKRSLEEH